jgi:hypothetical protein
MDCHFTLMSLPILILTSDRRFDPPDIGLWQLILPSTDQDMLFVPGEWPQPIIDQRGEVEECLTQLTPLQPHIHPGPAIAHTQTFGSIERTPFGFGNPVDDPPDTVLRQASLLGIALGRAVSLTDFAKAQAVAIKRCN